MARVHTHVAEAAPVQSRTPKSGRVRAPEKPRRRLATVPSREIALPHRVSLERVFGTPLDEVQVRTGPEVAGALQEAGAEAAFQDGVIFLGNDSPSLTAISHEVVHALQYRRTVEGLGGSTGGVESEAESVAQRVEARIGSYAMPGFAPFEIESALNPGVIAYREVGEPTVAPPPRRQTGQPNPPREAAAEVVAPAAAAPQPSSPAGAAPAGEAAAGEAAQSMLAEPPAPEPGVTPEQVAAREASLAEAQAALQGADSAAGTVDAFTSAPPSVKAQFAGQLGDQINQNLGTETQTLQQETPEIRVVIDHPPEEPPSTLEVAAPAGAPAPLEASTPPPPPPPEVAEIPEPGRFEGNSDTVSQALRLDPNAENNRDQLGDTLQDVQTTDPGIVTTPGERPAIPMEGASDPQRIETQTAEARAQSQDNLGQAQQAVVGGPGPELVQPVSIDESHPVGDLNVPVVEAAPAPEGAQQYLERNLPPEVQTAFDEQAGPAMEANLAESQAQVHQAATDRDQQHDAEVQRAQQENDRNVAEADSQQRAQVAQSRESIQTERQSTLDQQQSEVERVQTEADDRRSTDRASIDGRVEDDRAQIDQQYSQAETDAQNRVQDGERQAEAERAQAERDAENESWWDRAVNFIRDAFDALVSAINAVFDAVRSAVNAILDAARDFAIGLINAAAQFISDAIAAYGDFLIGLVQGLLGDIFPELAAALTEFIQGAVALAQEAVQAIAEGLRTIVNSVVEGLRAGINAVLDAYQAAVNAGLAILRAAVTGDWAALARQLFEAICHAAGIDPQAVYRVVGQAMEALQIIIDDPGQFLSNLVDAFLGGFSLFADNFLTHLQAGIINWLTGSLGSAGIQIPEHFDLMGVLSLVQQILGLTWENLRPRIVRLVGERGVQVLEFVASYVQTLITGGWRALWERIQNDLGNLVSMVLDQIKSFLVERVIVAAVTQLASLFSPVGAIIQLAIKIYNFCMFLINQIQRIWAVAQTVITAISQIAHGVLDPAKQAVENVLAGLLPLAIDLLARLLGLGDISGGVGEILQAVQTAVWSAIDRLIETVVGLFRGGGAAAAPGAEAEGAAGPVQDRHFRLLGEDHDLRATVVNGRGSFLLASGEFAELAGRIANIRTMLFSPERPTYIDPASHFGQTVEAKLQVIENKVVTAAGDVFAAPTEADKVIALNSNLDALNVLFSEFGRPPFNLAEPPFVPADHRAQYGPLDTFGRATFALGDPISIRSVGLGTNAGADPPGRRIFADYERGHLLANRLGGSGTDIGNLAMISVPTNTAMRTGPELAAGNAIEDTAVHPAYVLRYRTECHYRTAGQTRLQTALAPLGVAPTAGANLFALAQLNGNITVASLHAAMGGPAVLPLATVTANENLVRTEFAEAFLPYQFTFMITTLSGSPAVSAGSPINNFL